MIYHLACPRPVQGPRLARVRLNWQQFYATGRLVACLTQGKRIYRRDGNGRELPFLKDVLEYGLSRAALGDILLYTNDDILLLDCAPESITSYVAKYRRICSRRIDIDPGKEIPQPSENGFHSGRDVFAFDYAWLARNLDRIPDVIIGAPTYDYLLVLLFRHELGEPPERLNVSAPWYDVEGCDMPPGLFFHERHADSWQLNPGYPSTLHNRALYAEWIKSKDNGTWSGPWL